ncbi:MAG TPA: quinone-dependent dihydroorotate dehydrogenase [Polyangiaceae bacterium]|jgi:dihydroorotate dehydrogenase
MYGALRPLLFALPPDRAHAAAMLALAPIEHLAPIRALARSILAPSDPRLAVHALGLSFPSPLGVAGGFDKNAHRPRALAALGFGHVELGTVTARAQEPNPAPNLFRLPEDRALVNRLGFPNEGARTVCARLAGRRGDVPFGVSIGKSRAVGLDPIEGAIADYAESFEEARRVADFVVVNVSSPNTKDLRAMQGADIARALFTELTRRNADGRAKRLPLLVKIAPDLSDAEIEALLAVVEQAKLDGVVATNTTIQRTGLRTSAAQVEAIGAGGLSGPPLRARARDVVARVRARLGGGIAVVGVGGVEGADDLLALVRAGANLVQLYTGFIYGGPLLARSIARDLTRRLDASGARSVAELAGA